ncbi:two-component sensor histidine kinase [Siphonobacter sp. BAB-5385]|uniref:HAMP domain-containing sensor histidine kinase n=1 Tax=unclassified Siphonobacter TaxID=2635712 RepID=UPI000B9DE393|nr:MULTISPECIES: HAMP domain-containing sensor histidine kinase [unclassified Siphonobacter]OZI07114.1 two-component sensor histidine kinase [Siphonobacter sp. BAB-5385]PMD95731.1 two-component sensor histidine kinase [Siphonobacter sp. BAB-5405]
MFIRYKLALLFSLVVAGLLTLFSAVIYQISASYREEEFLGRLENKARTTARYLMDVKEIDNDLLKIIDQNSLTSLFEEQVLVFDEHNRLLYSSLDDQPPQYDPALLAEVREEKRVEQSSAKIDLIALALPSSLKASGSEYVVLASAYDKFGKSKLIYLRNTLMICWVVGVGLTVVVSGLLAGLFLRPIATINTQIQQITAQNLKERLPEGNGRDEMAQLAINFNQMLNRLNLSFEQQKSFVSHASHELRTPLAAMKTDIQSGLEEALSSEEYRLILRDLFQDTQRLIGLTNGLLQLARPLDPVLRRKLISIPELLLDIYAELSSLRKAQKLVFEPVLDERRELLVPGDEALLKTLFTNLIDNACKYSSTHEAFIRIGSDATHCLIAIEDKGIGIPPEDQERVFGPFFRANNALIYSGYGIGLAVSQRIAEWHGGSISLHSTLGQGSTFTVRLPLS